MNLYSMKLGIRNVRKTFRILKCDFYNRLHSLKLPTIYEDVCGDCHFSVQLWAKMTIFFSFFFFLCREYQHDYNYVYRWKTKDERSECLSNPNTNIEFRNLNRRHVHRRF